MQWKSILLWCGAVLFCGLLCVVLWVLPFVRRAHQLRTYADMQMICSRIDNTVQQRGDALRANDILDAVRSVYGGIDTWGNEYLVLFEKLGRIESRYLLVSRGSDGKLDIAHIEDYFDMEIVDIHGQYEKDIVFLNGEPLTRAGK